MLNNSKNYGAITNEVAKAELEETVPDLTAIDAKTVTATIEKINTALKGKQVDKK